MQNLHSLVTRNNVAGPTCGDMFFIKKKGSFILLQVAIGRRLGIEEPRLMKIMRATLHTHNEWFKLQMCKDRFESFLGINSLKDVNSSMLVGTLSKSTVSSCTHGSSVVDTSSSGRAAEDGSSPMQASSTDAFYDESAILKVMVSLV